MGNLTVLKPIAAIWLGLLSGAFLAWFWTWITALRALARKDEQIRHLAQLLAEEKATNDEALAMGELWRPKRDARGQFLKL